MKHTRDRSTMDTAGRPARAPSFSFIRNAVFILAAGIAVGYQIYNPGKRFIEGFAGLILVLLLWGYPPVNAILAFIVLYPFPFGFSLGYSNAFLIYIIFIIFLVRVAARMSTAHFDKRFSVPLLLIAASYLTSFFNLDYAAGFFKPAVIRFSNLLAAILFFYLVVNVINDEKRLRRAADAIAISTFLIIVFTIIELLFPGKILIPNWLYTQHKAALVMKGLRMGGPFRDYELLAEYFALTAPILFLLALRSKRLLRRAIYGALLFADVFMMFTTITRGAFISLGIGFIYLLFMCRRDLNIVRLGIIVSSFVVIMFAMETFVANYTVSGSLFERLVKITFEEGLVPSARDLGWRQGITRGMWHPFLGNGLELDWAKGVEQRVYPHNGYLFLFDLTGFFGLFAYLFLLYRLVRSSLAGFKSSLVTSPFSQAMMKILHAWLIMFMIDQLKIEYMRNDIYVYYVWLFFGLIAATANIIRSESAPRSPATHAA